MPWPSVDRRLIRCHRSSPGQSGKYLLVCGDFNDSPISYAHHTIGKGLTDAYREAGWGPGFSYNRNFLYFRIDHLFVNKGFKVLKCRCGQFHFGIRPLSVVVFGREVIT